MANVGHACQRWNAVSTLWPREPSPQFSSSTQAYAPPASKLIFGSLLSLRGGGACAGHMGGCVHMRRGRGMRGAACAWGGAACVHMGVGRMHRGHVCIAFGGFGHVKRLVITVVGCFVSDVLC